MFCFLFFSSSIVCDYEDWTDYRLNVVKQMLWEKNGEGRDIPPHAPFSYRRFGASYSDIEMVCIIITEERGKDLRTFSIVYQTSGNAYEPDKQHK